MEWIQVNINAIGITALLITTLTPIYTTAADKGSDFLTKPFWNIDSTYRTKFKIENIIDEGDNCNSPKTKYTIGRKTIFKEVEDSDNIKTINFVYIKDAGGPLPELNKPYTLCKDNTKSYKYRRAGGIDTGILVIPYKVRSGDLYGDSTLGPYIALKGSSISLLATFGLTQVSVAEATSGNVKTESGISYAVGLVWSVTNDFDVGLVAGKDHLSGAAGDAFEFQDKTWWSFAIGYNFTTE